MRWRRLGVSVAVAAVVLLAAEGWCSLGQSVPKYRLSSTLGYELVPGYRGRHETVNLAGLRGAEIGPKRPGALRVLAMGGSTTWGHKVHDDETWPVALERELRAATGRDVEVLNGGVSGWDLEHVVVALRQRELDEFRPDLVLVNVGWNYPLIGDNAAARHVRDQVIDATRRDGPYRSALVRRLAELVGEDGSSGGGDPLAGATSLAELRARCYPPLFAELRRLGDEHDARIVALRYPCLIQRPVPAEPEARSAYAAALRETLGDGELDALARVAEAQYRGGLDAVEAGAAGAGVEVLDLAARLEDGLPAEGADREWAGYFRDHAHFTPEGDAAVGRALAGLLVERGLVH